MLWGKWLFLQIIACLRRLVTKGHKEFFCPRKQALKFLDFFIGKGVGASTRWSYPETKEFFSYGKYHFFIGELKIFLRSPPSTPGLVILFEFSELRELGKMYFYTMKTTRGNNFSQGNMKKYSEWGKHGHCDVVREKWFLMDTQIPREIITSCIQRGLLSCIQLLSGYQGEEREPYLIVDLKMEKLLQYFHIEKAFVWFPDRIVKHHTGTEEAFSVTGFERFLQAIAKAEKSEPGVSLVELSFYLGCSITQLKTFIRQGLITVMELDGQRRGRDKYAFYKIKADDSLRALLISVGALDPEKEIGDGELAQHIISGIIEKQMPTLSFQAE